MYVAKMKPVAIVIIVITGILAMVEATPLKLLEGRKEDCPGPPPDCPKASFWTGIDEQPYCRCTIYLSPPCQWTCKRSVFVNRSSSRPDNSSRPVNGEKADAENHVCGQ